MRLRFRHLLHTALFVLAAAALHCPAALIQTADEAETLPQAALACKLKMGAIRETKVDPFNGTTCQATCAVVSPLKGTFYPTIDVVFTKNGDGWWNPIFDRIMAGDTYLVLLDDKGPPYRIMSAMPATTKVVAAIYGTKPGDRLMAELVTAAGSNSQKLRTAALEQIGLIHDGRGSDAANAAALDDNADIAKAGIIAQYRLHIAPDAKLVMALFDREMLDVWCQESGIPQKDANGNYIIEKGPLKMLARGVTDFDYAAFVREGAKLDWIRNDDYLLSLFFNVPWQVNRKQCVPELVHLLDDPDKRIRTWAILCLLQTVYNAGNVMPEKFPADDAALVAKWKTWYRDKGAAFMAPAD